MRCRSTCTFQEQAPQKLQLQSSTACMCRVREMTFGGGAPAAGHIATSIGRPRNGEAVGASAAYTSCSPELRPCTHRGVAVCIPLCGPACRMSRKRVSSVHLALKQPLICAPCSRQPVARSRCHHHHHLRVLHPQTDASRSCMALRHRHLTACRPQRYSPHS